ncbi:hypothetical protein ES702_01241 [subsurface metagenome]
MFESVTGIFSGATGGIASGLKVFLMYICPILLVGIIAFAQYRNKSIYRYKVRMFRIRENGKVKESNFKAGYIGRKNSAPFFRIKTGKWWWQQIDLTTTPTVKYMDEEDRVYYLQVDVNTFVQLRRYMNLTKEKMIRFTPVESDVKYGAILSVQRIKDVLRTEPTWKKLLPYFGLVLLAIVFIIAYAMLMNQCSG